MAQVTFEAAQKLENNQNNSSQFGYFSLKNNGDSAIVRFMESNVSDFNLLTCHTVQVNNRYRKLNCLRNANDPLDMCPACKANLRATTRYFAKMLMYTTNEQGVIEATPVVWERSLNYASQIRDLIMNYGDLKNCLFKITRNGAAGDMKTNYSIMYCPEQTYPQANYPIIEGAFDNFNPLGTLVLNKTAEDINVYLTTGNFPAPIPSEQPAPQTFEVPTQPVAPNVAWETPSSVVQNIAPPWGTPWTGIGESDSTSSSPGVARPVRVY